VHSRYRSKVHDVQFRSIEIMRGEHLWNVVQRGVWVLAAFVILVGGYAYLHYVLRLFPWTRALGQSLSDIFLQPLATLAIGFVGFIPDLVFLIILALVTRYVLKLVKLFFHRIEDGTITLQGFDPEWARATHGITRFGVVAFALVVAYPTSLARALRRSRGSAGDRLHVLARRQIGNVVAGLGLRRGAFRGGPRAHRRASAK
jgi:hypothetical protein